MKNSMILIALLLCLPVFASGITGFGVNAGVGTDVTLGLAFGGGASYLMVNDPGMSTELGLNLYVSISSSTVPDGPMSYMYTDSSTSIIYAVIVNALFSYNSQTAGLFTIAGIGAGGVSVSWKKSSTDDPTYNDSGDSTGGSAIINLGVGWTFGNSFELRLQLPIFITFTQLGTRFAPALVASAGLRF